MAVTVSGADTYISANVIDIDEWIDADSAKKQRILTVASSTLSKQFEDYTIPDNAVYEYAAVLAVVFSDTNRLQRHGVQSFSVSGVASFNFASTSNPSADITRFIPKAAYDLINADAANVSANLPKVGRRTGWSVM